MSLRPSSPSQGSSTYGKPADNEMSRRNGNPHALGDEGLEVPDSVREVELGDYTLSVVQADLNGGRRLRLVHLTTFHTHRGGSTSTLNEQRERTMKPHYFQWIDRFCL